MVCVGVRWWRPVPVYSLKVSQSTLRPSSQWTPVRQDSCPLWTSLLWTTALTSSTSKSLTTRMQRTLVDTRPPRAYCTLSASPTVECPFLKAPSRYTSCYMLCFAHNDWRLWGSFVGFVALAFILPYYFRSIVRGSRFRHGWSGWCDLFLKAVNTAQP